MARRIMMSVDPVFKDMVKERKKNSDLSEREITKDIAIEIRAIREKRRDNEIRFNL